MLSLPLPALASPSSLYYLIAGCLQPFRSALAETLRAGRKGLEGDEHFTNLKSSPPQAPLHPGTPALRQGISEGNTGLSPAPALATPGAPLLTCRLLPQIPLPDPPQPPAAPYGVQLAEHPPFSPCKFLNKWQSSRLMSSLGLVFFIFFIS